MWMKFVFVLSLGIDIRSVIHHFDEVKSPLSPRFKQYKKEWITIKKPTNFIAVFLFFLVLMSPISAGIAEESDGSPKFITIEAETAELSNPSKVRIIPESENNGIGCLEFCNGNAVTAGYVFHVDKSGYYSLDFRYNNQSMYDLPMILSINGKKSFINFSPSTDGSSIFKVLSIHNVMIHEGENKIELSTVADIFAKQGISIGLQDIGKGVWLDCIIIKKATLYEAEQAVLSGGAIAANDHGGYTGTGFVAGYERKGATTKFSINVPANGNYRIKLKYANGPHGGGGTKTVSLYVNSRKVKQVSLPSTGSWGVWSNREDTVYLQRGINTIEYRVDNDDIGFVNIDHIIVSNS